MSMCNVIGVLGDDEDEVWDTFRTAVDLADVERSRLTLAKTCDDGRSYVWVTPFGFGGAYVPPPLDSPYEAERRLARIAESVPDSIPVTTHVLGPNTQESLVKLLRSGHYNATGRKQGSAGTLPAAAPGAGAPGDSDDQRPARLRRATERRPVRSSETQPGRGRPGHNGRPGHKPLVS